MLSSSMTHTVGAVAARLGDRLVLAVVYVVGAGCESSQVQFPLSMRITSLLRRLLGVAAQVEFESRF